MSDEPGKCTVKGFSWACDENLGIECDGRRIGTFITEELTKRAIQDHNALVGRDPDKLAGLLEACEGLTTSLCFCGKRVKVGMGRTFTCPHCHYTADRDIRPTIMLLARVRHFFVEH